MTSIGQAAKSQLSQGIVAMRSNAHLNAMRYCLTEQNDSATMKERG